MTPITRAQAFFRPVFQPQGPDDRCIINGHTLGWSSCTCYAAAMGEDSTTLGHRRPSGCAIRRETGDTTGGTTLRQVTDALASLYPGTFIATYTGANVITPARLAALLRAGHKVVVQGNADAMIGTPQQSTAGPVNHAVMINSVWGGTTVGVPKYADVFDSAADGRDRSYHVDQGPSTWPWSLVLKFCANLRPNGPGTPRLGSGKIYAAVFVDSEPHLTLAHGGVPVPRVRKAGAPDRARADRAITRIHSRPTTGSASTVRKIPEGTLVFLYQYTNSGESYLGSTTWFGNPEGTEWIHEKNLRQVGGDT